MKRLLAALAIASLPLLMPAVATAQLANQEYCDATAFEGDTLIALNSGWCHATNRPFISTYFYEEFDDVIFVVFGMYHADDPQGYSRIGIFRLPDNPEDGLVEIVTATFDPAWQVTAYHAGEAETARIFQGYFVSALEEIEAWHLR